MRIFNVPRASEHNLFSWLLKELRNLCEREAHGEDVADAKCKLIHALVKAFAGDVGDGFKLAKTLLDESTNALRLAGYRVYEVNAETGSRLLVGTKSPFGLLTFEVGLSFHPLLNLPYIPSSSLKGALRSYLELSIGSEEAKELLGTPEGVGRLIITDAFPVACRRLVLEPEVTTPIYKDTFEEHRVSPTPIPYLAIARGVAFRFIVGMKNLDGERQRAVLNWIKDVLQEGIGAKTMLGYGIMGGMTWKNI